MKKITSILLSLAIMLSSVAAYAGAAVIVINYNNIEYKLGLTNYVDGLEEILEERLQLNDQIFDYESNVYPEVADQLAESAQNAKARLAELDQIVQEKYNKKHDGVMLDFNDGSWAVTTKYPELVIFPSTSYKYDDFAIKYNYGEGEPVIHTFLKYSSDGGQDEIKNIIIENGILSTELVSLNDFPKLTSVVIPESVNQIMIKGADKYYEKTPLDSTIKWPDYFGIPSKEFYSISITENGITSLYPSYEHHVIMQKLGNEHDEKEEKKCTLESNNKIVFYTKANSFSEKYLKELGLNVQQYVSVKYKNKEIYSDQPAITVDGRTLVPLRAIFEALGASVEWDGTTNTVVSKLKNTQISLQIDSNQLYINGKAKTIDVPAKLINGRTMVPARAVAEAFGCKVSWDDVSQTVTID